MIPEYLKPNASTRLKPCAERMVETCDSTPADKCCGVIPCKLCLEWEEYDGIQYGSADVGASSWTGTVGGHAFVSYWQRNAYDECEYIVTLAGEEVYRATCDDGASCRNPQGEVAVSTAYLEGTLRWAKYEPRELALAVDPDTGCRDFFCGSCRCSCDCLCVTITEPDSNIVTGEICDVSYSCDPPVWAGSVGYYELSLALGRDSYGECIVTLAIDDEKQSPVAVTGCANMSGSVTLYNGTTIAFRCKQCDCLTEEIIYPCECANDDDLNGFGSFGVREDEGGPCDLEYTSSSGNGISGKPTDNIAWIDAEDDCVITLSYLHKLTAFPPDCMDTDSDILSKRLVFVKKGGSGVTPNIDNSIVQENDWYVVVYAATTDTILGVYYEFDICCFNETPENAATSHFVWVRFPGVSLGGVGYTVGMYSQGNADTYGNCGYEKPGPAP